MFKGQNAEELVHLSIKFKKRTTSYEIEHIDSKVIDLNDYHEDEQIVKKHIMIVRQSNTGKFSSFKQNNGNSSMY